MTDALTFALVGLGPGAMYALAAQGIVLIYRGSGVLNFAQGALAVVGAFGYLEACDAGCPPALAVLVGVAVAAAGGALTQLVVMFPLRAASALTRLVATLGVMTIIQSAAVLRFGGAQRFVQAVLPSWTVRPVAGAVIGVNRLYLLGIAVVLTAVLWVVYRFTRFGVATSAVAENQRATAALGHSPELIALANWTCGAGLAGLAGALLSSVTGLSISHLTLLVLPALAAALVGGFSSFPLTLLGGLGIGIAESELTRYVSTPGWSTSAPLLVIVFVLVVRGRALPLRSHLLDRLPRIGTGRVRATPLVVSLAAGIAGLELLRGDWIDAVTTTLVTAVICLSLVVVVGYAGQLSLAQYTLAGIGAFIAAHLSQTYGLPFPVVALAGMLGTIPVGLLVALPALRARGVNLAIATLGLATVIEEVVFSNSAYTGGFTGIQIKAPVIAGIGIDAIRHRERYGVLCLVVLAVLSLAVANLRRGRAGRRLVAVRDNERAAAALGISVFGAKLYAFGLGAAIAGLGGVLTVFRAPNALFTSFDVFGSINVVVLVVIGGVGFVLGSLLGAVIATGGLLSYLLDELTGWERYLTLISGVLLIVTLIQSPDGIAMQLNRQLDWLRRRIARPVTARDVPPAGALKVAPATLEVSGLVVRFGGVLALDGVSLTVGPGEVVGLIGPNGAGKTTLIDAVSGLARTAGGTVSLDAARIDGWSPLRRSRAGIARSFQSLELFENLTVRDNLRAACDRRDRRAYLSDLVWPGDAPLPPAAVAAVVEFGLASELDRRPQELSHGRRRLVAIARAVAAAPSVLLLDEPAAGLDDGETQELGDLIRRLARDWGIGVLLVEHDVAMVMSVCDRIVALDVGRPLAEGTPEQVRADPAVVAAYLGTDPATDRPEPRQVLLTKTGRRR